MPRYGVGKQPCTLSFKTTLKCLCTLTCLYHYDTRFSNPPPSPHARTRDLRSYLNDSLIFSSKAKSAKQAVSFSRVPTQ